MSAIQTKRMKEIFVVLFIFTVLSFVVHAATFATTSQSDFNQGTYVRTFYNTSGFVQLNTSMLNGSYASKIFDAGKNAQWQSILWSEGVPYGKELPNNQATETYLGGANMTRDVLLVHFNNDTGENATFIKDWSGFGNNGTCSGTTCPILNTSGRFGKALNFDGSNDRLNFSSPSLLNKYGNQLTLEAWIQADSLSNTPSIIEKSYQNQFAFYFSSSNLVTDLVTTSGANQIIGSIVYSTGKWYHIVFTYNGSQMKLYSNGLADGSPVSASGNVTNTTKDLLIGAGWEGSTIMYFFDGLIDEAAIYNRTLNSSEVLDHYKRGILRMNMSVRSCDDDACSGESFTMLNFTPSQPLSVGNNKYFQYAMNFTSENISYTPQIYNNSVVYATINQNASVTLNVPNSGSVINANSSFLNFTVYDPDLDNMTVWVYGDTAVLATLYNKTNATQITYNWTNLNNGLHNWSVVVNDGVGNYSSSINWFTINYTAPNTNSSITINSPGNNSVLTTNYSFLNASVYDKDLNNMSVWIYGNGTFLQGFTNKINGSEVTYNWTPLSNGNYNWSVVVNDGTVNVSALSYFTINYTAPNVPPNVSLNSPSDNSVLSVNSTVLNFTVYDNNLNNMTTWLYGDGAILNLNSNILNGTQLSYAWNNLNNGVHTWSVVVHDGFENTSSANYQFTINYTVPNTAPSVQINSPTNNSILIINSSFLNASIYDNDLNNLSAWIYGNGTLLQSFSGKINGSAVTYNWTPLNNGNYNWTVVVNDGSVNVTQISYFTINYTVPNTAPSISITTPSNNSVLSTNSTLLNASVYDIDLNTVNVSIYGNGALLQSFVDKTNGSEVAYNWTNLNNGLYNWSVVANDGNGTINVLSFFTINYTTPNNAPEVQLNNPTNGANITTNSATLNATVYDKDLNNMTVWFYGDGSMLISSNGNTNGTIVTYNWISLTDGTHNWSVVVHDGFVNTTSNTYSFLINTTVPNTVPSITLNVPANNSALTVNSTLLNATVYDNELNTMTVWFYGDGSALNISYNVMNATQVMYNWTGLNNSLHTWHVVSYDGTANTTSITYQFLVNVTEPPAQATSGNSVASNTNSNDKSSAENDAQDNSPAKKPTPKPATTQKKPAALFDIAFHVDQKSKEVMAGTEILTTVSLINFGEPGKVVATVVYVVKNANGDVVYELEEQVPVETQNEFVKSLAIPRELEPGAYTIGVTLKYGAGQEAYSEDTFVVIASKGVEKSSPGLWKGIGSVAVLFALSLFIYLVISKVGWSTIVRTTKNILPQKALFNRKEPTYFQQQVAPPKPAIPQEKINGPYYVHEQQQKLRPYVPPQPKRESVRERLERLQEQNFKRISRERKKGGFAEPVQHVETYLYPHDKETIRARLERLKKKTERYRPLTKETIKPVKKEPKAPPPKSIQDLGLED